MSTAPSLYCRGSAAFGGVPVFDEIDLRVAAGQWTCLLGSSGVGKSTILKLFAGLGDEADAYAARLTRANVKVELINYPGMIHGFMRAIGAVDVAQLAIDEAVVVLKRRRRSAALQPAIVELLTTNAKRTYANPATSKSALRVTILP